MSHPRITQVSDQDFKTRVLEASEPIVVDFWAEWCGPCRALAPVIDELASDFEGKAQVMKLDIDANPITPAQYGIRGIPTVTIFKNGEIVEQLVGNQSKASYAQLLRKHTG